MLDPHVIIDAVVARFGVSRWQLLSPVRTAHLSEARKVLYWLLRKLTDNSTTEIGILLHRDHSTVIFGAQSVEARMKASPPSG